MPAEHPVEVSGMEGTYYDVEGRECSLDEMCRRQPAWAASRLRTQARDFAAWKAKAEAAAKERDEALRERDAVAFAARCQPAVMQCHYPEHGLLGRAVATLREELRLARIEWESACERDRCANDLRVQAEADRDRLAAIVAHLGAWATTARDAGQGLDPIGVLGVIEHEPAPAPAAPSGEAPAWLGYLVEQGARSAESLAQRFHETYERLAPSFGYETRKASAKPWADVPEQNRLLMIAVCAEILSAPAPVARRTNLLTALWNAACAVGCEEDGEIILARALRAIEDECGSIEACLGAPPAPAPVVLFSGGPAKTPEGQRAREELGRAAIKLFDPPAPAPVAPPPAQPKKE